MVFGGKWDPGVVLRVTKGVGDFPSREARRAVWTSIGNGSKVLGLGKQQALGSAGSFPHFPQLLRTNKLVGVGFIKGPLPVQGKFWDPHSPRLEPFACPPIWGRASIENLGLVLPGLLFGLKSGFGIVGQ